MSQMESSYECFTTDIYAKGDNSQSQCGIDNLTYIDIPRKVNYQLVIRQIACGRLHSLILTNEGQVYAFGSNAHGQLGVTDLLIACAPVLVQGIEKMNCVQIAAGDCHSDDKQLYFWGNSDVHPKFVRSADNVKCGLSFTIIQDEQLLYLYQAGILQELQIQESISDFACSSIELFYLDVKGNLYNYGQGVIMEQVQQIFNGYYLSLVTEDGVLYFYKESKLMRIDINKQILDSAFNINEGVILDENNKATIIDLTKLESTQYDTPFHSVSCGVNHILFIGMIQNHKEENDSIMEQNLSPIGQRQVNLPQNNNTFSFSIKKDLQLLHSIKLAHKEVQTDEDYYLNKVLQENQDLKKVQQQQRKNLEIQIQFQRTLQEQIQRLQQENERLKSGKNKQQLLQAIRQKQNNLRSLIDDFYQISNH